MKQVLFIGEMLIDFIPDRPGPDGTLHYQPHPGGAVANAAVALARMGGAARFIGKLGEDSFGRMLLHTLQENGVDTRFTPTTVHSNTTLVLVTLQADGQREFLFYRQGTADTRLDSDDIPAAAWDEVALLHAGSVLLASEPARSTTLHALDQARQRGLAVSFDVNTRPALWSGEQEIRETLEQVVPRIDLLKCSAEEAHYLDPAYPVPLDAQDNTALQELGQRLLARGPSLVIITRGEHGALLLTRSQSAAVSASGYTAIDTTGAGDAFMGTILCQLVRNGQITGTHMTALSAEDLERMGTLANRAAGISCTRYGGIYSLPYLAEVDTA